MRFSNGKDIDCYVPNIDYFHFSIYESKSSGRYKYNLGIGNNVNYSISNITVRLYKFTITYKNDNCRLVFTPSYYKFTADIRFTNYVMSDTKELLFIKNKTPIYVNSYCINLRLLYTPDLHSQVKSVYGELSGHENLEIKNSDKSIVQKIEFEFDSDMFLIANVKFSR